jgi:membrane protein DedA with SNARE-associated domain
VFEGLFDLITNFISSSGYFGVFFFMVLESMIFPVPSEAIMPFAGFLIGEERFSWLGVFVASSAGSLVGSWLSYWIGLYGGRPFLLKFGKFFLLEEHHLEITEKFFAKFGNQAVLISRFIPVVRHLISIPAGLAKMNPLKFTIDTFIGASTWNMFLAYIGFTMQERWHLIKKYTHYLDYLVVLGIIGLIIYFYSKRLSKVKS